MSNYGKHPGEGLLEYNREFIKQSKCRIRQRRIIMNNEFSTEDREMLVRVDERTKRMDKWMFNHDSHHFRYNLLAWSVALGAIITLAICVLKLI